MKPFALTLLSLFIAFAPSSLEASEASRLRKVLAKRDHEIAELRKEIDGLHRQLANEQPYRVAKSDQKQPDNKPTPPAAAQKPSDSDMITYVVVSGDTLSGIARQHKTSVAQIKRDNGLRSNLIRLGQKLKIQSQATAQKAPPTEAPPTAEPKKSKPTAVASQTYKIKAGDTFYSIARNEGLTIAQLKKLNPTTDASRLRIGQSINLAGPDIASVEESAPVDVNLLSNEQSVTILAQTNTPKKAAPKTIAEVELDKEMTFSDFAKQQSMTMERLNELNGHSLAPGEWLAKGSVFYVEN